MPATSCRMEHGGWGISRRAAKAEPRGAGSASPHRDLARAGGGHWLDVAHGLGSLLDGGEPLASHRGLPAALGGGRALGISTLNLRLGTRSDGTPAWPSPSNRVDAAVRRYAQ